MPGCLKRSYGVARKILISEKAHLTRRSDTLFPISAHRVRRQGNTCLGCRDRRVIDFVYPGVLRRHLGRVVIAQRVCRVESSARAEQVKTLPATLAADVSLDYRIVDPWGSVCGIRTMDSYNPVVSNRTNGSCRLFQRTFRPARVP